jgi:hypothetical protein
MSKHGGEGWAERGRKVLRTFGRVSPSSSSSTLLCCRHLTEGSCLEVNDRNAGLKEQGVAAGLCVGAALCLV